ncbi:MAG: hypothetical protein QG629_510 [Patescibacteria group bacterium]|nr:hypothetical protein [Patescibacteria group bacterium]
MIDFRREKSSQTKCEPFCLRDEKNRQVCLMITKEAK